MENTGMGHRIRQRRLQLGIGLRELSRRAGTTATTLSDIERGVRDDILISTLKRLAIELGVSVDYLSGMHREYGIEEEEFKLVSKE